MVIVKTLILLAIFFGLVRLIVLFFYNRKRQQHAWLKKHGRKLVTHFVEITTEQEHMREGIRDVAYRVITSWTDETTSRVHTFESEELLERPVISGQEIVVYANPTCMTHYYMEIPCINL